MKKLLLFSLLASVFLLTGACVNGSYHDDYDSRHRPPPGHRPPPDNRPAFRPDHKPGPPPAARPDSRPDRPAHRP